MASPTARTVRAPRAMRSSPAAGDSDPTPVTPLGGAQQSVARQRATHTTLRRSMRPTGARISIVRCRTGMMLGRCLARAVRGRCWRRSSRCPASRGQPSLRPRLLDRLDAGVQGPLTLVAAPAGAGKSALLSSWIAEDRAPGPVAWLSLDTDDADRRRFWRGVLAALAQATGDDAVAALAVSPREPMTMGLVLPALADALARRRAARRARARRLPRGHRRGPRGSRTARCASRRRPCGS